MRKSRFTEEQIAYALRQVEQGTPVAQLCRKMGVPEQSFFVWKKKYVGIGVAELRKVKKLEEEVWRLKQLVADLSLDKQMLREALSVEW
jgi:putative transposase